jgi:hypothetical protein
MKKLFLLPLALFLVSCSDIIEYKSTDKIVSVYYHERNDFSVGIVRSGMLKIVRLPPTAHVDIFMDAASKDDMWYECDHTRDRWNGTTTGGCSIHLFDVDDITGAGWNHGKFGSGTTKRID